MNARLGQLAPWTAKAAKLPPGPEVRASTERLSMAAYDAVVIMFSGGKDSIAALLETMRVMRAEGADLDKLELWHQCIDGDPRKEHENFMDWGVTEAYCQRFAYEMGLPLLFQWKEGGFLREMERNDAATAPTTFMLRDGTTMTVGGAGPKNTRRMFPQTCGDLKKRWCSAYLKIDVAAAALRNIPRFNDKTRTNKVLVVTGERWEESSNRARYPELEPHRSTTDIRLDGTRLRRIDQWRPVVNWNEALVWKTLMEAGINAHPCYDFGYSRASCATCIFGGKNEWATIGALCPSRLAAVEDRELDYGKTITTSCKTVKTTKKATLMEKLTALANDGGNRAYTLHCPVLKAANKGKTKAHKVATALGTYEALETLPATFDCPCGATHALNALTVTAVLRTTVAEQAAEGESFIPEAGLPEARAKLLGKGYTDTVLIGTAAWNLPSGAFRENNGPC